MRTTTRDIIKVCADIAKLDKKGKLEVLRYLQGELSAAGVITSVEQMKERYGIEPQLTKPVIRKEGGEQ